MMAVFAVFASIRRWSSCAMCLPSARSMPIACTRRSESTILLALFLGERLCVHRIVAPGSFSLRAWRARCRPDGVYLLAHMMHSVSPR